MNINIFLFTYEHTAKQLNLSIFAYLHFLNLQMITKQLLYLY